MIVIETIDEGIYKDCILVRNLDKKHALEIRSTPAVYDIMLKPSQCAIILAKGKEHSLGVRW